MEQQEYIDKRLNERDRVLMQSLNESMETQKQLAVTQQEAAEEKKGFFSKIFKK